MKMKNELTTLLTVILLFCGVSMMSQEWEFKIDGSPSPDAIRNFADAIELSDGGFVMNAPESFYFEQDLIYGRFPTPHPALVKCNSDGVGIVDKTYFRPSYCSVSIPQLHEDENGDLYVLMTYSPDHEYFGDNYFKNFDNPPTSSILGLYKLDDMLNIEKSYEHYFPIDTSENRGEYLWEAMPNESSGNIYLFTSIIDDGDIVGAFFKNVTLHSAHQPEHDSLFLFRMNFNGEILQMKSYECPDGGGGYMMYRGHCMIKTDSHYILYRMHNWNTNQSNNGEAVFFDKDLNYVASRRLLQPGFSVHDQSLAPMLNLSVAKGNGNISYLASQAPNRNNVGNYQYQDCRLYEFDNDLSNSDDLLPINKYIVRGTSSTEDYQSSNNGVIVREDNTIVFVYNMNIGDYQGDSWIVIEHLDNNFDAISTMYYTTNDDNLCYEANSVISTKDGGLLLVGRIYNTMNAEIENVFATKFPASAFVSIEEAHAHNLKVAVAYPNPGGDVMNIRTSLRNCTLQVYDMQGRIIHQQIITDEVTSIDASKWNSGTYIWNLKTENGKLKVEEGKWVK